MDLPQYLRALRLRNRDHVVPFGGARWIGRDQWVLRRSAFAGMGGLEEMLRRYRSDELEKRRWRFIWQPYD